MRKAAASKFPRKLRSKAKARLFSIDPDISWIRTLAEPYFRDYRASAVTRGPSLGYRFSAPHANAAGENKGFFVGYLLRPRGYEFLDISPPECAVFSFIHPPGSPLHKELVAREDSLLRNTAEYIGWLTHRPPRFAFFEDREVVLVRHCSMRAWPEAKQEHYSRNFFIETLAWLVRSGLVAKLRGEKAESASQR